MTRDSSRSADLGRGVNTLTVINEFDLVSALWEQAPFPRLPWDAPGELRDIVGHVDNPNKLYVVHKASRRHNIQLLISKYVIQLREGCDAGYCTTSTCFTCRRRIAGRAPLHRYNPTSARTLAVYLASQDNAEHGLCPRLKPPSTVPAVVNSLMFAGNQKPRVREDGAVRMRKAATTGAYPISYVGRSNQDTKPTIQRTGAQDRCPDNDLVATPASEAESRESALMERRPAPGFSVFEIAASADYRSFAANLFGTVAFKMLEWLTPNAIEKMRERVVTLRAGALQVEDQGVRHPETTNQAITKAKGFSEPAQQCPSASWQQQSRQDGSSATVMHEPRGDSTSDNLSVQDQRMGQTIRTGAEAEAKDEVQPNTQPTRANRPASIRRNSNAHIRRQSGSRHKLSIDSAPLEVPGDESFANPMRSPRVDKALGDRNCRVLKTTGSVLSRPISQLSAAGYFDEVKLETMPRLPPPLTKVPESIAGSDRGPLDDSRSSSTSSPGGPKGPPSSHRTSPERVQNDSARESGVDEESELPQTMTILSANLVNFICDVLQADGTAEKHSLEPSTIYRLPLKHPDLDPGRNMRRKTFSRVDYPLRMKSEWKLFLEQSIFFVLSDAQLLVHSFTRRGQVYDSHTLWYCMLRLERVAPTLVFHSLWLAAARLFVPPKSLQSLRSPTGRLFPRHEESLSNNEAGYLMSICLHALVATAPVIEDPSALPDLSRIRSHGLSLARSGAMPKQPEELCLQYDDAFTHEPAVRLARRLFTAITTRRHFDDMSEHRVVKEQDGDSDVLAAFFSHMNFMSTEEAYILDFSFLERTRHETRVPIVLLDWAKTIMFNEWDGNPEVSGDGPFGGALALIAALHQRRFDMALGDPLFKCEYFADRLDPVEMPVAWLNHTSTRQKLHLLDFPHLFNASNLVSYFRSINFSRMSRAFEEANSVQTKIQAITTLGSLVVNPHHKEVVQDLLKTASSKFLILDISRENVVRDAFDQLWRRQERELLRPLKVHLGERDGEEGFDSGGVQQEFFRMAFAELLNPDYGAFTVDDRTRMTWFQPGSIEPVWKFELVGLLTSLAVYNGLTLPVTFPKAIYRKLLNESVDTLEHIADGWPELASGLNALLDWDEKDGLVEDIFARTYEFSVPAFGQPVTLQMKPVTASKGLKSLFKQISGPSSEEWPQFMRKAWHLAAEKATNPDPTIWQEAPLVTKDNREAYVRDYIRYLTDVSVRPQYEAFARGFRTCLHPKGLTLLTSALLQSMVEGVQDIDVAELRRCARYVGWDASHRTVRDFWSIVRRFDDAAKRRLLEFVTASDRVPVGGIKNLQFVVQKNGTEDDANGHLPTAYTCYGTLLLPEYRDKDMLRERLQMALENAQGFGFA